MGHLISEPKFKIPTPKPKPKPNFQWTTILASQLIELHVWAVYNIVISWNTIFYSKVTNTKRIWKYLNS